MALYDKIGAGYNSTRCADPYIADRLYEYLVPKADGIYLDIGCGTGNYLKALAAKGLAMQGADPSVQMLAEAVKNNPNTNFTQTTAEALPFTDNFFDGVIGVLTIHHWADIRKGLSEILRVLKEGDRLVLFSFAPEQMRGYWLRHYFPVMIERCLVMTPPCAEMEGILRDSGFTNVRSYKYFVREDLQDHFLYSYKHKPEMYLIEEVRNNSSGFRVMCDADELTSGLTKLREDIKTGEVNKVIKQYENDLGDYLFFVAEK